MKIKKVPKIKNDVLDKPDICAKCGDKYYDLLGIGSCSKCFDKTK